MDIHRRVVLIIADGWGVAPPSPGNYISQAKTPNFDNFLVKYPNSTNVAAGNAVGVPEGSQGNSEIGHLHIGAGRIVWQMLTLVNKAIDDGSLFEKENLKTALEKVKNDNSSLHIFGMFSDEGIHSHINHAKALLTYAQKMGIQKIYIHFIADGRDVPEKSAQTYVDDIEKLGIGKIASVVGRYYAMDRDNNWDRTQKAYDMLTLGKGFTAQTATEAVSNAYARGDKTDYYIQPTVIVDQSNAPVSVLQDNDLVIFFNFRTDRPRQLSHALKDSIFDKFNREKHPTVSLLTMTPYDTSLEENAILHFHEQPVVNNLGSILSQNNLKQLRLAETDKYAHVTYFFNSEIEKPFSGEDRILIPSPKVPSYDLEPEMSAREITKTALQKISENTYDFMLINFANCDLVGHAAVKKAVITAVETVDQCVGTVVTAALATGYTVIFTADHGNAEDKLYSNGQPRPSHSTNPVPFILISRDLELQRVALKSGGQQDVAPTILEIMGLPKPPEMTGTSLIHK
ncbi:MAG: 2,3-bisphosphoglycerate-independent phosphoglycerate mutase [Patescibacteria group bacterium]|jgi:2,3-bisphosphoglycerate-independent phosphoglycerate mutase